MPVCEACLEARGSESQFDKLVWKLWGSESQFCEACLEARGSESQFDKLVWKLWEVSVSLSSLFGS